MHLPSAILWFSNPSPLSIMKGIFYSGNLDSMTLQSAPLMEVSTAVIKTLLFLASFLLNSKSFDVASRIFIRLFDNTPLQRLVQSNGSYYKCLDCEVLKYMVYLIDGHQNIFQNKTLARENLMQQKVIFIWLCALLFSTSLDHPCLFSFLKWSFVLRSNTK